MSYYPFMFAFGDMRPVCSKKGCRNEAQYYTWMTAVAGSRIDKGWHMIVTACNVHVEEYSIAVQKEVANWEYEFKSKQEGGETSEGTPR